jgi:hypothetical protein
VIEVREIDAGAEHMPVLVFRVLDRHAAQHRDFDAGIEQGEIDAGFHPVERGLILGVEEARIAEREHRRLAAPLDRSAGQFDATVLHKLGKQRLRFRLWQQHRLTEVRSRLRTPENGGDEQALVDLQSGLLTLTQPLLRGDVLGRRHETRELPGGGFHELAEPHETRALVRQGVIYVVGMPMQKGYPGLACTIAHIARRKARSLQRFRQV